MAPIRFESTFIPREQADRYDPWRGVSGIWETHPNDDGDVVVLSLAPRAPRRSAPGTAVALSGFIPSGEYEGALLFERPTPPAPADLEAGIAGELVEATADLDRRPALLTRADGSRPGRPRLDLRIGRRTLKFHWVRQLNDTALASVCIYGHRGLGFEKELGNTRRAFEAARTFGVSAVEMDVMIPYDPVTGSGRVIRKVPVLDTIYVHHPVLDDETLPSARVDSRWLTLPEFMANLGGWDIPLIYVDPKFKWVADVDHDAFLKVMNRMVSAVGASTSSDQRLTIGAPGRPIGELLAGSRSRPSLLPPGSPLSWTMEWTEISDPGALLKKAALPPSFLSFSLLRIGGSRKLPGIDWLFTDLSSREEERLGSRAEPFVFWTATEPDHYQGALASALHESRMARPWERGALSIMTDHPHRLAHWLASDPWLLRWTSTPA